MRPNKTFVVCYWFIIGHFHIFSVCCGYNIVHFVQPTENSADEDYEYVSLLEAAKHLKRTGKVTSCLIAVLHPYTQIIISHYLYWLGVPMCVCTCTYKPSIYLCHSWNEGLVRPRQLFFFFKLDFAFNFHWNARAPLQSSFKLKSNKVIFNIWEFFAKWVEKSTE